VPHTLNSFSNIDSSIEWSTVSKAALRSRTTIDTDSFRSKDQRTSFNSFTIYVSQLRWGMYADWCVGIKLFVLQWVINLDSIHFSRTLDRNVRLLTGQLLLVINSIPDFFKRGLTIVFFQVSGNSSFSSDLLINWQMTGASIWMCCLMDWVGILSSSQGFIASCCITSLISSTENNSYFPVMLCVYLLEYKVEW
jgi:hypothetical protein